MARLIDADALLKDSDKREGAYGLIFSAEDIRNAPTIEAEPVKHGKWIKMHSKEGEESTWCCSECSYPVSIWMIKENYCPNCGSRMDGE